MFSPDKENYLFNHLLEIFSPIDKLAQDEMELAAIWLNRPITLPNGSKVSRLSAGMKINVIDGEVVCSIPFKPASHKIIGCYGNISNTKLFMQALDLSTMEPSIINMK